MRKRTYRTVDVKSVEPESLREVFAGRRLVVSVDVAKWDMVAALVDEEQTIHRTVAWRHPSETRHLLCLLQESGAASIEVVLEPSGTYGDALRHQFAVAGAEVYRVSPKRAHDAAEVYDGIPSWHDAKSAAVLAELHLDGRSEPWPVRSDEDREVKALVAELDLYAKQGQSLLNQLEARLACHWPELTEALDLSSASLIELVSAYGSPAACAADPSGVERLLRKVSRGAVRKDKAALVLAQAAESLGQPMIDRELGLVRCIAAELLRCRQQVTRLEREIDELCGANALLGHLRRAVGPKTAAVVVAALGDPRQYARPRSYLKALGLALKEKSSGTIKGKLRISKRGPGRCRWYLYLAVLRWIMADPIARAWYEAKVARDGGQIKGKAVVALMRKLVKALWHVAHGATLDSRKLFDLAHLGLV